MVSELSGSGEPLPESAMASGSDAGTAGEREPAEPGDAVAAAVEDDAPLPPGAAPGTDADGAQDAPADGATPEFREP